MSINEQIQEALSLEILSSIKEKGLIGRDRRKKENVFSVNSADGNEGHDMVCVDEITLAPEIDLNVRRKRFLLMMLKRDAGLWSIALERDYTLPRADATQRNKIPSEMKDRLQNTIVLILKPLQEGKKVHKLNAYEQHLYAEGLFLEHQARLSKQDKEPPSFQECRVDATINFKQVIAILVPKSLTALVSQVYPELPLYTVGSSQKLDLLLPGLETMKYYPKKFRDPNEATVVKFSGPNYVEGLETFCDETSTSHFACHIVKLPTLQGIQYGLDNKLPHLIRVMKQIANSSTKTTDNSDKKSEVEEKETTETTAIQLNTKITVMYDLFGNKLTLENAAKMDHETFKRMMGLQ